MEWAGKGTREEGKRVDLYGGRRENYMRDAGSLAKGSRTVVETHGDGLGFDWSNIHSKYISTQDSYSYKEYILPEVEYLARITAHMRHIYRSISSIILPEQRRC